MAISKSTPYVRYKKDFTSSLHLGTIHIESEYLDRTQKTTIESIHGMTWHNKVVNENKELNLLSDTQLELTDLEKQYWNTGEKCVSVDEIHTLEEVEPNEDGTYTYTVNSMEGEYIEIYDGINNITSTSDGLDGQFEIVYDTTEEDINGNIALDQVVSQYEITDSGVGTITSAKSTGLTLVNNITEPSKEEVVAIEQQEGKHFTIENTVQGNIKSAILKGNTLVNVATKHHGGMDNIGEVIMTPTLLKANTKYYIKVIDNEFNLKKASFRTKDWKDIWYQATNGVVILTTPSQDEFNNYKYLVFHIIKNDETVKIDNTIRDRLKWIICEYQEGMEYWDIPFFEGIKSVKMPVLTTTGKNIVGNLDSGIIDGNGEDANTNLTLYTRTGFILLKKDTSYVFSLNGLKRSFHLFLYDLNKNFKEKVGMKDEYTPEVDCYIRLFQMDNINNALYQVEEGKIVTPYEPYKSNILTVNESVELRGIEGVQDELNVTTGELTQRIGEIVLDGSYDERWWYAGHSDTIIRCNIAINIKWQTQILCADMPVDTPNLGILPFRFEGVANHFENYIYLYLKTEKIENYSDDSTNEDKLVMVRDWLSKNPITIQYQLATESVKTVDLTVQNQDGNTIPHIQTQQGITHVSTSSDVLTPVVEMSCSYDTIIKPNTTYTIKLDRPIVSDTMYLQVDLGGTMMMLDADVNAFTIKTPSTLSHSQLRLSGTGNTVKEIIVLESNRVNDKIEYFEGMKNVENPILVVSNCPYVFGKGGRK